MADETDTLLHMIQEQWAQARQAENHRVTITNFIIVIASAILGFIAKTDPDIGAIPLTIFVTALGIFGLLMSMKLYERFYLHIQRVGRMMERLDQLLPKAKILHLEEIADERHRKRFGWIVNVRLHWLWMAIHCAIIAIGSVWSLQLIRNS